MKRACTVLLTLSCLSAAPLASAQTAMPKAPESSMNVPDDPGGIRKPRGDGRKVPSDPGAVVTPPTTGTEAIVKTPKNVDPQMDDATPEIDRKSREKSRDKAKAQ